MGEHRRWTATRFPTRSPWRAWKLTALSRSPAAFTGVVVGEVVECGEHPNADGTARHQSQRGRRPPAGHRLRRAKLPSGPERWRWRPSARCCRAISKSRRRSCAASRLRGCCAPSPSWVPPTTTPASSSCRQDAPVGTDIREYLKLDDNTIEISVTPNRADCLGIIGVARDVAVLNTAPN